MPFIYTFHTTLYYDIFQPDPTLPANSSYVPETVLLIHGFAGTPASDFADPLLTLRSRYRVLAPHLHGYGRSTQRSLYTLSYYREDVADLVALLDALSLASVRVLSFSDGAIVGTLLAALHPERVKALVALGGQPTINEANAAGIRHWLLETPLSEEWQAQLAQLHGEPYWRKLPAMYVEAQEALVAAGGVLITKEELAAIRCPTLIMHGKRDRIVPVEYAHILHKAISGSQLLIFDAGHPAHVRCKEEFNRAVMEFFQ